MPSTYTTNLGIEKIATGEQSGTWGNTTNTNLDILDQSIDGIISITLASAGSSGSPNSLPITDGAVSNGRNKFIEFVDGGDLGATAYVQLTPNDSEKIVHIRNSLSASRSIIVFQGTYNASNDYEILNGEDVLLKFDGAGAGAVVSQVFANLALPSANIDGGTIDGATIGGSTAGAGTFTSLDTSAVSGIIESNGNFIDTCLVGPSVDDKAWAGAFSNGSVWTSLMLATVETSGANAEVNIWDLTAGTLASASPLATVTLTGATPTSIAASMGYVIVGTSDQGMHIVDPHGGSWAERTIGWPRSLTTSTTPALADNNVVKVFANAYASTSAKDPRTAGPMPTFAVYYGAGAVSSIITDTGSVYDDAGTPQADAVALLTDGGTLLFNDGNAGRVQALQNQDIHGITADNWGGSIFIRSNNYPQGFGADNGADNAGDRYVFADTDGLTLAIAAQTDIFAASRNWITALLTTTYNTGFLAGDIRLAALANSKTADRSYNANTLTENGTVTEAAVETGAEAKKYSGFSASNYLSRAYDADFDFGTGSLSILLWFYSAAVDSDQALVHRRDTGHAGAEIKLRVTSSGTVNFQLSGSGTATPTSAGAYDDGRWHLLVGTFDGTTTTLNIDGGSEVITDATDPGNLNNGTAVLRIGLSPNGNSPADDSAISLVRISASSLSSDQIKQIYEAEKGMFVANAKCLLQGASNAVLDARVDPLTGKYIVTQSDTQDIFDGLTIETERTIATGGTTFEHGLLWGDAVAEINDANLFASTPATDQRQVNEMVRSMSAYGGAVTQGAVVFACEMPYVSSIADNTWVQISMSTPVYENKAIVDGTTTSNAIIIKKAGRYMLVWNGTLGGGASFGNGTYYVRTYVEKNSVSLGGGTRLFAQGAAENGTPAGNGLTQYASSARGGVVSGIDALSVGDVIRFWHLHDHSGGGYADPGNAMLIYIDE